MMVLIVNGTPRRRRAGMAASRDLTTLILATDILLRAPSPFNYPQQQALSQKEGLKAIILTFWGPGPVLRIERDALAHSPVLVVERAIQRDLGTTSRCH